MRLNGKILATMMLVLVAASLLFLALFMPLYQKSLRAERQEVSERLGESLKIALENAMLKRDLDGLRDIVARLGTLPNVEQVLIAAPNGEVRFASRPDLLGHVLAPDTLCRGCGAAPGQPLATTDFTLTGDGREVLRAVNAVANRDLCQGCHGVMEANPINGYLIVDYQADALRQQAASLASIQGLAGLMVICGALLSTWLALRHFVLKPVKLYAAVADGLAKGSFDASGRLTPALLGRKDEIADLGQSIKTMASNLEATIDALHERDVFQQAVIDGVPDGIRIITEDYEVVAANRAFGAQVGLALPDILAKPCYASSHGREAPCAHTLVICPLQALKGQDQPVKCSHTHLHHTTNTRFAAEVVAAPIVLSQGGRQKRFIVEAVRDLSHAMQVSQEQRLSELGQLAAGVAHEIHNPLASVRLGIRAIHAKMAKANQPSPEMSDYLTVVDQEIDRCIQVTDRLMRLTRIASDQGTLIAVSAIVKDIAVLLRYEMEVNHITLAVHVPDDLRIVADEGELGMVLVNLIQNALHAMPGGGAIRIDGYRSDNRVRLAIADNGHGIAPETLAHIFHPFFSRRFDGSTGSGLGLSICKSLVEQRGGIITVTSQENMGTTFILCFPDPDAVTASDASGA